ncbi:MAG: acyloxyacyl hydrolase [Acidobacteria bacterium]|nr:acyloxyacyl hydrolase [Acidobacteriota bacterium]
MPPAPPPAIITSCHVPDDPARREWSLVREGAANSAQWALVYRSAAQSAATVTLPLRSAVPAVASDRVTLHYRAASGWAVSLDARADGPSTIDVVVHPAIEMHVEPDPGRTVRDTDRIVDAMNTEGLLAVTCSFGYGTGAPRGDQWMLGAGYAWGIALFQSNGGQRYTAAAVSWARDLTRDLGPGLLRGRLMWGVEAMPFFWQDRPTGTAGIGISPLVWRWRFVPRPRVVPFIEFAFGGLVTGDPVPEGTKRVNFLTHGAFGLRWRPAARVGLVTAYRFQHISNGNQQATNPGVNAHVLWFGVSFAGR